MEDYYNTLLKHLDGYTVMGLFEGKRDINNIVTLQTGHKGRVFFFDQEPMIKGVDDALWDYIFQEPTIFANSELDSTDKEYVKAKYSNFIDWYYFSHGLIAREWFSIHKQNYAGWFGEKTTLLDCNLISGFRQYRIYLMYMIHKRTIEKNCFLSFNGENWRDQLIENDYLDLLSCPKALLKKIPTKKISYDNWGKENVYYNNLMQTRIPMDYYSRVDYISVSETLFLENKKHLTEKIFKPIVAGKPFILFAGHKNLQYLKDYGFETFDSCWNEDYDNIVDPKERIHKIFELIYYDLYLLPHHHFDFHLSKDSPEFLEEERKIPIKKEMFNKAHAISLRNREYFWSNKFYNKLISEAIDNLEIAKTELASKSI